MATNKAHIDPYLFERHFHAFRTFVEEKSGSAFLSFASNRYTDSEEGYKSDVYRSGRDALGFQAWERATVGNGVIARAVIAAIQLPDNNLLKWQEIYGEEGVPHRALLKAIEINDQLRSFEECLFRLYREEKAEQSFTELVSLFGKKYSLIAYLLFLKDRTKYLPIATTFFDRTFELLGAQFKTTRRCSWENYLEYVRLITEIKAMLGEALAAEISLLDAHSFAWILASQMERENKLPDVNEYVSLPVSEREAIVKARIGQGRFRQSLIDYWSGCAVTGCLEAALLRASHIKPWAQATLPERVNLYNGLLLSPALDACFDAGYVSFDDEGAILISEAFVAHDAAALGINSQMRLRRVDPDHKKYVAFHREHVFRRKGK
ncbi:MAG TPA: HNH endonuclease [Gemmataceae bacterium]|jgi:predicted restriction endonuclease|nr:HNH endonuclease [Gemmataceae bacterium]